MSSTQRFKTQFGFSLGDWRVLQPCCFLHTIPLDDRVFQDTPDAPFLPYKMWTLALIISEHGKINLYCQTKKKNCIHIKHQYSTKFRKWITSFLPEPQVFYTINLWNSSLCCHCKMHKDTLLHILEMPYSCWFLVMHSGTMQQTH